MNLLLHGQAPWSKSAYGNQLRMLGSLLEARGHNVAQACTFGFQGRKIRLGNVTLYPALNDLNGQDVIRAHAHDFKADYVLSLGDVFLFDPSVWGGGFRWLAWATVDSRPLWPGIRRVLGKANIPVAYSLYGQRVMQSDGFEAAHYIPLAFDPEVFYAAPFVDARSNLGIPGDRFVVGMVQANRQLDNRKNFFDQIIAFRDFQKRRTDALLYLHTCMSDYRHGFDLFGLLNELGMTEGRDYMAVDEYTETTVGASDDQMRDTYNALDVLLQATKAEGFGVPALEASACRKPVIYTDYAALPEAVHYGYRVGGELEWQPAGSWYMRPDRNDIVDALERAYQCQAYDLNRGEPAAYRMDVVSETHWAPFLERMESELQAVPA